MKIKLKKLFALLLTVTVPLWIIPFMVCTALFILAAYFCVGMTELYDDMCKLVGADK